jgi:hypothetical protein
MYHLFLIIYIYINKSIANLKVANNEKKNLIIFILF